jgi:hypothetical protein
MKTASLCLLLASFSLTASAAAPDLKVTAAKIDELVNAKLAKEKITPNKPASDEIFVRRVYLDVVGRIPTLQETTQFLKDSDPEKRSKLIDELIANDGYVQNGRRRPESARLLRLFKLAQVQPAREQAL